LLRHTVRLAALAVVVLGGLVQGRWTGRWSQSTVLSAAVSRLDRLPENVGDWQSRPLTLDRKQIEIGEIAGHALRVYTNRKSRHEVRVLVVCGRPGPISVHTPDVCFKGAGFEAMGAPAVERLVPSDSAKPSSFQTMLFRKGSAGTISTLQVYWAWNARGSWEAPENPRLQFAPHRFLYKLYVVREVPASEPRAEDPICQELLRQLTPQLEAVLFPPTTPHAS
jgi:hypothetical protein